jgi:hypothetical protein
VPKVKVSLKCMSESIFSVFLDLEISALNGKKLDTTVKVEKCCLENLKFSKLIRSPHFAVSSIFEGKL